MANNARYDLLRRLLEDAADEFAIHGCNDYEMENTDENWDLMLAMYRWSRDSDAPVRPPPGESIVTYDWLLMRYLSETIRNDGTFSE